MASLRILCHKNYKKKKTPHHFKSTWQVNFGKTKQKYIDKVRSLFSLQLYKNPIQLFII